MIRIITAAALLCALAFPASSRPVQIADPGCNVIFPCEGVTVSARGARIAKALGFGMAQKIYSPRWPAAPAVTSSGREECEASQYGVGDGYNGKRAADGSIFDTYATSPYTVAMLKPHRLGSFVTVINLANGKSIRAKVTDRGPYYHARCVDVGRAGADALGMGGTARVMVE